MKVTLLFIAIFSEFNYNWITSVSQYNQFDEFCYLGFLTTLFLPSTVLKAVRTRIMSRFSHIEVRLLLGKSSI